MNSHIIFDFNQKAIIKDWVIVDDGVMGGKSAGSFSLNEQGHGVFEGSVSLENNGGFSSLRYSSERILVQDFTTIALKIKGDGKNYQFRIKSNTGDYYSYITTFSTSGEWQEIQIDLKDMYPSFRGRKLDQANFEKEYIEQVAFLIGNKKEEKFKLLIDKIELK
ncbi:MAG: CIA30 family protein [Crocinitomicaceae bacterium]|jgi:hypothetical protein|tara:strand:+ start:2075 stop:2566 length:492 start_codon:yes stop_codon:yes gene_type:complete